jgi:hypothetical protein
LDLKHKWYIIAKDKDSSFDYSKKMEEIFVFASLDKPNEFIPKKQIRPEQTTKVDPVFVVVTIHGWLAYSEVMQLELEPSPLRFAHHMNRCPKLRSLRPLNDLLHLLKANS